MHNTAGHPGLDSNCDSAENLVRTRERPAFQRGTDKFIEKTMLWAFPRWVSPNQVTVVRFVLIPVILVLLGFGEQWWAFGVFIAAVSTDFIDGAIARTRDQITLLGTYIDPIADKLLIAALLAWVGHGYLVVQIVLAAIALELIVTAIGASILLRTRSARASNAFGKTKMVVQSVAVVLFLVSEFLGLTTWVKVSLYLLWLALALAAVSGCVQIYGLFRTRQQQARPSDEARPSD